MMARTHVPIGVAASILIGSVLNKQIDMVYMSAAVVGSLMPDADHPKSMINQKILPIKTKHSQTIIYTAMAITALMFNSLIPGVMIPFVTGYAAHIAADCFTNKGVTLLWPYQRKIKFFITISTESYSEQIIAIAATSVCFLLFVKLGSFQLFF